MDCSPLRIHDLTKHYGGVKALDLVGCSLQFEPGKVTAVLGSNGAGKTTLFNLINGVLPPDNGAVHLGNVDITWYSEWRRCRLGIARSWQDVRILPELNCIENIQVAIRGQRGEHALVALFCRSVIAREERATRAKAEDLLEKVGLADVMSQLTSEISYGQQKLLSIARVICNDDNRVVLLDEPMAGLDQRMSERVASLICTMKDNGVSVILVEHDLHAIRDLVDYTVFLDQGRCIATGALRDVLDIADIRKRYMGIR